MSELNAVFNATILIVLCLILATLTNTEHRLDAQPVQRAVQVSR